MLTERNVLEEQESGFAQVGKSPTFFVVGGTLSREDSCYVTRQADDLLLQAIHDGEFVYVLTARQMGKSSLMTRAAGRLRQDGVLVVILDFTRFGTHNVTAEQWYAGLLAEVGRAANIRKDALAYWKEQGFLPPVQRFFGAMRDIVLKHVEGRVVVFVDEVDAVLSLPFPADEFFAGIRECWNRRTEEPEMKRLTWGLFGVASPSDLIRDTRMTPFNIGRRIELVDFTRAEAEPLARALGGNGSRLMDRVYHWTNGHPYLTLRICRTLAEREDAAVATDVDALVDGLFFGERARETEDNLLFVRERVLRGGNDRTGPLELYRSIRQGKRIAYDEADPLISLLRLSGLIRIENGAIRVRNRIYEAAFDEEWIESNVPEGDLLRVRQAYQAQLRRTILIAAGVGVLLCCLLVFAVQQMITARQESWKVRRLLTASSGRAVSDIIDSMDKSLGLSVKAEARLKDYVPSGGVLEATLPTPSSIPTAVTVSPSGSLAVVGDSGVYLYDLSRRNIIHHWVLPYDGEIVGLAFSADETFVAALWNETSSPRRPWASEVRVWAVRSRKEIGRITTDERYPHSLNLSNDGERVTLFLDGRRQQVWDVVSGKMLLESRGEAARVFPSGRKILVGGGKIQVYRISGESSVSAGESAKTRSH